jgi:hypothetical protein
MVTQTLQDLLLMFFLSGLGLESSALVNDVFLTAQRNIRGQVTRCGRSGDAYEGHSKALARDWVYS